MEARHYFGFSGWEPTPELVSWEDRSIARQFDHEVGEEPEYVYAIYNTPAYEGHADVVFKRDGKWFLVNGGHCSCYGLEGQWEPEEIDPQVHFKTLAAGNGRYLAVHDTEGEFPEATQERFNLWLAWAVAQ